MDGKLLENLSFKGVESKKIEISLAHLSSGWKLLEVYSSERRKTFKVYKND
jgi:hypothetical protein